MLKNELPKIITESLPGPKARKIIERRENAVPTAIRCAYPVVIERGEGAMIEDVDGNRFLDWIGGVGVLNIGFSHPEVVEAVKEQAEKYGHSETRELAFLVAHSMLHLSGYDHMEEEERLEMEQKQSEILERRGYRR